MPIPGGVDRYRWKTLPSGKKIRLAFKDGKVVETKKEGGKAKLVKKDK